MSKVKYHVNRIRKDISHGTVLLKVAFIISISIGIAACAGATGPKFMPMVAPQDGAIIHVYRLPRNVGGMASWYLSANGKRITTLSNGGFYTYKSKPGNVTFSFVKASGFSSISDALIPEEELITVSANAGETIYVRFVVDLRAGMHMVIKDRNVGESEIKDLKMFDRYDSSK